MHIETELDDLHAERLLELQRRSNQSLPKLVADILKKALDEAASPPETEPGEVLRIMEKHGLLGCMDDDQRLSVEYKKHLWK